MRFTLIIPALLNAFLCIAQPQEIHLSALTWTFCKAGDSTEYKAFIPGTVHTDLLNHAVIQDPFFGNNEKELQWIENETWIYKTTFRLSEENIKGKKIRIIFEGLDTYAKVLLNGKEIIIADNMFRTWQKDIEETVVTGINQLEVIFEPAAIKAKEQALRLPYKLPGEERVFVRKAQYHFGWDWGPRFVTCGIWKDATILIYDQPLIEEVSSHILTLTDSIAEVSVNITLSHPASDGLMVNGIISDTLQQISAIGKIMPGDRSCRIQFRIKNPVRWWCNGLGEAHLYRLGIQLVSAGKTIDEKKQSLGLRTIELIQEEDATGRSFYFRLNGIPVFAKGANYIPQDNFVPRVGEAQYLSLLKRAADGNMNMLRVWGGGIYEKDLFYDLCDSLGLMVWQDFMFACAMYPGDSIYINNVCEEIRQQVKRLRHHPCIALWCGNNENDEGWHNWGWQKDLAYTPKDSAKIYGDYLLLFEKLIPQILSQLDSSRSYHPSSPATGWGRPEAYQTGDVHYWGVWWGMEPLESYRKKTGRFVSEYGFQALPPAALLKKYLPENGFSLKSDALKNHQKHPTGFETIRKYMERDYKVPAPTEKYIYVSQLLQALAMETAIEAHRKSQPACMGSLFWQLNDCWPAISWSCTDFENHPKAAYYSIKNCFREIILVNERHNDKVFSFLVSDAPEKTPVKITVELVDFMGNIYYRKVVYQTAEYHTSRHCFTFPLSQLDENSIPAAASLVRYTMLINNSETRIQYFYFEKPKNLSLIDPGLKTEYAGINKVKVIATNYLAKNVFLYGDDIIFDDNFFDLLPGQSKTVTYNCLIPDSQTKSIIRAISLFDAMK